LCGCETVDSYLREEHKSQVYENKGLSKMWRKWDEVYGQRRILHNEELLYLYKLPGIVRAVKSVRVMRNSSIYVTWYC
jgi:hypothetical protein